MTMGLLYGGRILVKVGFGWCEGVTLCFFFSCEILYELLGDSGGCLLAEVGVFLILDYIWSRDGLRNNHKTWLLNDGIWIFRLHCQEFALVSLPCFGINVCWCYLHSGLTSSRLNFGNCWKLWFSQEYLAPGPIGLSERTIWIEWIFDNFEVSLHIRANISPKWIDHSSHTKYLLMNPVYKTLQPSAYPGLSET